MSTHVLVSPRNTRIFGPLETLTAYRKVSHVRPKRGRNSRKLQITLSPDRTVFHDSATIVKKWGKRVFVDFEGEEYLESELRLVSQEEAAKMTPLTSPPWKPGVIERLVAPIDSLPMDKKDRFIFKLLEILYLDTRGPKPRISTEPVFNPELSVHLKTLIADFHLTPESD